MNQDRTQQPLPDKGTGTENQHQIAENPNPRANENIAHAPFEEKDNTDDAVGTEITDGESG